MTVNKATKLPPYLISLRQLNGFEVLQLSQVPQFYHRVISSRSKVVPIYTSRTPCGYSTVKLENHSRVSYPFSEKEILMICPEWPGKFATFARSLRSHILTTLQRNNKRAIVAVIIEKNYILLKRLRKIVYCCTCKDWGRLHSKIKIGEDCILR